MMTIIKSYANISAGQIHYRHAPGKGVPVFFFHRTPVWSSSFDRVFAELAGWRPLYAFDTPGFGESFTPPEGVTISDYRDWFLEAIGVLGAAEFHLCGHHTGSHFAIEIAAHAPTRCRSLMIDGVMYHTAAERQASREARTPAPPVDQSGRYITQAWSFLLPFYPTFVAETVHQEFVGAMRSLPTRDTCVAALLDQDVPAMLHRVRCPVLACAAMDDVYVDLLPRIAAAHANVTTSIYGKAGIAAPELQSNAFAAALKTFIDSV